MSLPCLRLCLGLIMLRVAAVSVADDMLISNYWSNSVLRFSMKTGKQIGALTGTTLSGPLGITLGPDGKVYVASEKSQSIITYDLKTGAYAGNFVVQTGLQDPTAIFFDKAKTPYVANFKNSSIARYAKDGKYEGAFVEPAAGGLKGPDVGATFGPDGDLYVPSFYTHAVLRYDGKTGRFKDYFVAPGAHGMKEPRTILFRDGNVWIASDAGSQILRFKADGNFIDAFIPPGSGGLKGASGMAFGNDGYLYVGSLRTNQVLRYDEKTGAFKDVFIGSGLNGPVFIAIVPSK